MVLLRVVIVLKVRVVYEWNLTHFDLATTPVRLVKVFLVNQIHFTIVLVFIQPIRHDSFQLSRFALNIKLVGGMSQVCICTYDLILSKISQRKSRQKASLLFATVVQPHKRKVHDRQN